MDWTGRLKQLKLLYSMKLFAFIFLTLLVVFFSSCYYDNLGELKPENAANQSGCDTTAAISYSNQIVPILEENCTGGCHNPVSSGFDLTSYTAVNNIALDGSFLGSVQWLPSFRAMPASAKISDCNIAKIRLWIAQGSLNN